MIYKPQFLGFIKLIYVLTIFEVIRSRSVRLPPLLPFTSWQSVQFMANTENKVLSSVLVLIAATIDTVYQQGLETEVTHRISPPYLHDIFQFSKDVTGHLSRNVKRLFVPRVFTNYGKRTFFYRGTVLWNNLKSTVTGAATLSSFRNYYLNS